MKKMRPILVCIGLLSAPAFAAHDRLASDDNIFDRFSEVTCVAKSSFGLRGMSFFGSGPNRMLASARALRQCRVRSLLPWACRIESCGRSILHGDDYGRGDGRWDNR